MSLNEQILSNEQLLRALVSVEHNQISSLPGEKWETLVNHGSVVALRSPAKDGLFAYVLLGELDLTPEQLVAVNKDLKYRNTWDEFAKTLTEVEVIDKTTSVVYWRVAYPWPMSHRDYMYQRLFQEITSDELLTMLPDCPLRAELVKLVANKNNNITCTGEDGSGSSNTSSRKWWVLASAPLDPLEHEKDPANQLKQKDRPVRVNPFESVTIITQSESGNDKCQFYSYLFENPGGAIPKTVINWFAKTAMPKGISQTVKAGKEYNGWKAKN